MKLPIDDFLPASQGERLPPVKTLTPEKKPRPLSKAGPLPKRIERHIQKQKSFWKPILWMLGIFFLSSGVVVGLGIGILNQYLDLLPTIPYLENYSPWMPSRMFSGHPEGELIADFFNDRQNREMAPLFEMPKNLIDAVVTLEDIRFYKHFGIDLRGFIRAAIYDLKTGTRDQGGSTLTMQLAEDLILNKLLPYQLPQTSAKAFIQKIYEILLSLQIEKRYTKNEILEIYLNQAFMGSNIYGVANAAEFYFGKPISDLNLKECALFAGMLQAPNAFSPVKHPEKAQKRTELVLRVMKREGVITEEEYRLAAAEPFNLKTDMARRPQIAKYPYFSETVHRQLANRQIQNKEGLPIEIYGQGVDIYTTIDIAMQEAAEAALRRGIIAHEQRRRAIGGRNWGHPTYRAANSYLTANVLKAGIEYDAKTVSDYDPNSRSINVELPNVQGGEGPFPIPVDLDSTWLDEFDLLKRGYFIRVAAIEGENGTLEWKLAKDRYVQGSLVAVQPTTGKVLAIAGGFDYNDAENGGQFIRAIQSVTLQPGSAFKPLLYSCALSAPAPNRQWTIASLLKDEERDFWRGWTPRNFEGQYYGLIPMRFALVHSLNSASVWLLDNFMGSRSDGIKYFQRFCKNVFDLNIDKPDLSIALGTSGTTPMELTQAYSVLANRGNFVELHTVERIYQRKDSLSRTSQSNYPALLYEFKQPYLNVQRMTPEAAYLTTFMMRGVVDEGTGAPAKDLPFYCVGKTGTTDDCVYAWFAGYTNDLLCVVYLGYDDFGLSLGRKMTGSKVALPVWMDFMEQTNTIHPELFGEIPPPDKIVFRTINQKTGGLVDPDNPDKVNPDFILTPFVEGTEPVNTPSSPIRKRTDPYQSDANKIILSDAFNAGY
ncbi:MAG: transglycosylase domain-containing protein [Candidatus Omnitrophota bacterium]